MPKKPIELVWSDIASLWLDIQPELAKRGFYADFGLQLVTSSRKPSVAHDLSVELCIRKRHGNLIVWRDAESLKVPGRMKLRPLASVLGAMLQRALYEIMDAYPLPDNETD